ncbi:YqxA family protein [Bacillus sp. JJ1562]|uniref:YqxA family protein n=1 Tax=Bacillus sp. JJ1562 TaxID=3122960 RepID=UPI0030036524
MVKFIMKCFLIVTVLLLGVLIGMQQANEGMKNMRGYNDPSLQGAFHISDDNGEVEASVLGRRVTSHDLEQKQKQLEDVEAFNLFSSIGEKLGNGISTLFEKIMIAIGNGIGSVLDKL